MHAGSGSRGEGETTIQPLTSAGLAGQANCSTIQCPIGNSGPHGPPGSAGLQGMKGDKGPTGIRGLSVRNSVVC